MDDILELLLEPTKKIIAELESKIYELEPEQIKMLYGLKANVAIFEVKKFRKKGWEHEL